MCVRVLIVMETLSVGVILALRLHRNHHPHDVSPGDDVIKMATAAWAEPDLQRFIVGGYNRKLLCGLTATVRAEEGSGNVDEEKDVDEKLLRFKHFIFRNRMQISQRC